MHHLDQHATGKSSARNRDRNETCARHQEGEHSSTRVRNAELTAQYQSLDYCTAATVNRPALLERRERADSLTGISVSRHRSPQRPIGAPRQVAPVTGGAPGGRQTLVDRFNAGFARRGPLGSRSSAGNLTVIRYPEAPRRLRIPDAGQQINALGLWNSWAKRRKGLRNCVRFPKKREPWPNAPGFHRASLGFLPVRAPIASFRSSSHRRIDSQWETSSLCRDAKYESVADWDGPHPPVRANGNGREQVGLVPAFSLGVYQRQVRVRPR